MVHTISKPGEPGKLRYLQQLWDVLTAPDLDLGEKLERLFAGETAQFGLEHAFFSHIDLEAETQKFEIVYNPSGDLEPGNTVPLPETYCRKTIAEPEGTMTVNDAVAEGWEGDPAYERIGFGSYVGTTVTVEKRLYGTLCFANTDPREDPITDEEETLVEMYSQWVRYELTHVTGLSTDDATLGGLDISESRLDLLLETLSNPVRRSVLRELVDVTECSVNSIERTVDTDDARIELHHNHLPKLDQAGFVMWDKDSRTISRGRNFFDVEPFVRLLPD
jgi:GAF domain-containing protein